MSGGIKVDGDTKKGVEGASRFQEFQNVRTFCDFIKLKKFCSIESLVFPLQVQKKTY